MAWNSRRRPPSALPPAESPSTRYSSHFSTSRLEQSRSLPGRPPPESAAFALADHQAGLAGALARFGRQQALLRDDLGRLGILFEKAIEEIADGRVDDAFDLAVAELGLGLAFELRLGHAQRNDGRQAFAEILARGDQVLEEVFFLAVGVQRAA